MIERLALRRSATLVLQALLVGRVTDGLQPERPPLAAPEVRLLDRDTGAAYGLPGTVKPGGAYAFYGLPDTAFPELATRSYRLRVEASAPGYHQHGVDVDVGPVADQPQRVTRAAAHGSLPPMAVTLFTGTLPLRVDLTLERRAVRLSGRVVEAAAPARGVGGATLTIAAHGLVAHSDARGAFAFAQALPLALSLEIHVAATEYQDATLTFEPDYGQLENSLVIALSEEE